MNLLEILRLKKNPVYHPQKYFVHRRNKQQYIIHHYCPHTYNAGDHFVILSIRKHLQKYLPNSTFIPKAVAGNRGWGKPIGLRGKNIYYSNKYADAVLLGGSDQYNDWSPKITAKEIQHLVPPLFMIGLGVSSHDLGQTPYLKDERYKDDIIATNQKSILSSVRDEKTQKFLHNLGYSNSIITGCPALFLFNKEFCINNNNQTVLFTFPYPLVHNTKNKHKRRKFNILFNLIHEVIKFVASKDLKPVIVCHDDRDVPQAQRLFSDYPIFFSNYPQKYFELYQNARLVLGSRLHATILASSLGIPSININLDLRGTGFSETFKLDKWNVDYNDTKITQKVKKRVLTILDNDSNPFKEFINAKNKYHDIFANFIQTTAKIIREF